MPSVINFDKRKISLMAFTSENDFRQFMQKLDSLYESGRRYPKFYMIVDSETKQEDIFEIQEFIESKMSEIADFEMIKRNIEKGRFPELTG